MLRLFSFKVGELDPTLGCFRFSDLFELDLGANSGALPRGRYNLELTATQTQKKPSSGALVGVTKALVKCSILFKGISFKFIGDFTHGFVSFRLDSSSRYIPGEG